MRFSDPPTPSSDAHAVHVDGETILYAQATGRVRRLDRQASLIWALLDGRTPFLELVAELSRAYSADEETVQRDVLAMFNELADAGFLAGALDSSPRRAQQADSVLPDPPSP